MTSAYTIYFMGCVCQFTKGSINIPQPYSMLWKDLHAAGYLYETTIFS